MSNLIKTDTAYQEWIKNISKCFKQSQIKAAVKVNEEMLRFYWMLGHDMDSIKENYSWGSHFYAQISKDIQKELPDVKSFSPRNLLYMHQFYRLFPDTGNIPAVDVHSEENTIAQQDVSQNKKESAQQVVAQSEDNQIIFMIPWGHIIQIMNKCGEDKEKALFYIRKTLNNNWSRAVLLNFLDTDLFERQGKAITNFATTLPSEQSGLAQEITKDPYNFDFLTIRENYDEKELKDALMDRVNNFLMELGTGFAFMGREVRLEVGNTEKFLDMLFYNTQRHCYVVVEVKAVNFDPAFAGQLGTYVVAVNHTMKTDLDNPTLGLLVCKGMDRVEAQFALESSSQPLGISSYELTRLIPEEFKGSMPTIEEIEAELADEV